MTRRDLRKVDPEFCVSVHNQSTVTFYLIIRVKWLSIVLIPNYRKVNEWWSEAMNGNQGNKYSSRGIHTMTPVLDLLIILAQPYRGLGLGLSWSVAWVRWFIVLKGWVMWLKVPGGVRLIRLHMSTTYCRITQHTLGFFTIRKSDWNMMTCLRNITILQMRIV